MKQKKLDHLDLVCLEIAKYNKIHNTYSATANTQL